VYVEGGVGSGWVVAGHHGPFEGRGVRREPSFLSSVFGLHTVSHAPFLADV